ncbi:TIGR00159 family protein [Petralouisia muris]|jgi:diadenylate cyclase|uniref:TIGR00159 family protein n=1 Tax=Petralouisia muris TaxID=3032872 RepID=A0AC61RVW0_9FIRM|nr:diadenylate cyclase CdaA [Petralouisia muris]TGY95769.1 TIGR00159 family protein [Petralouisia muris]
MVQDLFAALSSFASKYLFWVDSHNITRTDIAEIIIISFLIYNILVWFKQTRAWNLLKGIIVVLVFVLVCAIFQMNNILWIAGKTINVIAIAIIIVFQPELRRALEQLGQKNFITSLFSFDSQKNQERFSERVTNEIVKATYEMAKVKTGALIVVEQDVVLGEFERTGIALDSLVSSQLLINIFEHNTPLHDGAIIVRGDRIVSATCYLPLSDNMGLSKELGTRHRAAVGISEVCDALTIVVSEETGNVSIAIGGELYRNVDAEYLKGKLNFIRKGAMDVARFKLWKRRMKNVQENDKTSGE